MAENLTDEKLDLLIKNDSEFIFTKKMIIFLLITWISISVILFSVVDEEACIIGFVIGIVFLCPILFATYKIQKKQSRIKILSNYYGGDNTNKSNTNRDYEETRTYSTSANQQRNTVEDIAVNIAASYALGQAVSKAMDEHPIIKFPNDNSRNLYTNRTKVSLVKGGRGWLSILPNGNQLLTDLVDRRIAAYDAFSNETVDGNFNKIGKGNMLGQFYR